VNVDEFAMFPPSPRESGSRSAVTRLGIGQIYEPVLRKLRMHGDVEESDEKGRPHCRDSGDRLRIEHTVTNDPKPTGALGDEHVAIGKKGDAPRMRKTSRDNRHTNLRPRP